MGCAEKRTSENGATASFSQRERFFASQMRREVFFSFFFRIGSLAEIKIRDILNVGKNRLDMPGGPIGA